MKRSRYLRSFQTVQLEKRNLLSASPIGDLFESAANDPAIEAAIMQQFLGDELADDFALLSTAFGLNSSSTEVRLGLRLVDGVPQGTDNNETVAITQLVLDYATPAAFDLANASTQVYQYLSENHADQIGALLAGNELTASTANLHDELSGAADRRAVVNDYIAVLAKWVNLENSLGQINDSQLDQLVSSTGESVHEVGLFVRSYVTLHRADAGYGDDTVIGTSGNDVLDGGHGEDWLEGGDGDDILASTSDGREPVIAQDYTSEDDPNNEIDPNTRTFYPDQPIEADDVLIGGGGADTFYFRTLINAKRDIILRHVNSDGTINWGMNGVAGENDNVHDHWVDGFGNDVIWDFSRSEGDRILIEGHTTEVYKLEHKDSDGDGILDSTVLHVWSNQGNGGGAHNKDLLGTITVFGDLVTESDYEVNKTDYGIVESIDQLDEALTPRVYTSVADDGAPPPTPVVDDGELPTGGVFGLLNPVDFSGEYGDHLEVTHTSDLQLEEGTIALNFTADDASDRQALFSKDFTGNRDGGDLTAFVEGGRVKVRFQSATESQWLKTPEGSIQSGQEYHLAMTFGDDGFWLYLDGQIQDVEVDFTQGLEDNTQNMAIGANTWGRDADHPERAWDYFKGQIANFMILDSQYDFLQVAAFAGYTDPPLTDPTVIDEVLQGTDDNETLDITQFTRDRATPTALVLANNAAEAFQFLNENHPGQSVTLAASDALRSSTARLHDHLDNGTSRRVVVLDYVTVLADWNAFENSLDQISDVQLDQLVSALDGSLQEAKHFVIQFLTLHRAEAGYGDDTVMGTSGNDVLDGGHGEDWLEGGDGDDLLISNSDGREPVIAQDYTREDDPNNEIDPNTRTFYPDQPIEADDVLIGGGGADTFYFRTLINAKRDIILRHVNSDGTINWGMNGVAGENDNVHDHWVDGFGNDVIWDFSRSEGDRILIEGHTTEVYKLEHKDSDGDGILDSTVLHVWSNQGNGGGAHNKDLLGTITVFGDLVMHGDYEVNRTDFGIVESIDQLDEALTPRVYTSVADDGTPPPTPVVDDGELPSDGVFGMLNDVEFNGDEDHIEVVHTSDLQLEEGTIALNFTAVDASDRQALFSKDFTGNRDGGDLTAFVEDGRVKVRFQSATESVWLKTAEGSVRSGQEYHVAVTFGDGGFWLYLDGQVQDVEIDFTQGLEGNTQNMAIGASTWSRDADHPERTWDYFEGSIGDFLILDTQYDTDGVRGLDGNYLQYTENGFTLTYQGKVLYVGGNEGDNRLLWSAENPLRFVMDGFGFDVLDGTKRIQFLASEGNNLSRLVGSNGDDFLHSRPGRSVLSAAGMQISVNGFQRLVVDAGEGMNDQAYLYDSDGNDVFVGREEWAYMQGNGYYNQANGFDQVTAMSSDDSPGDRAILHDSAGDDSLFVRPNSISLQGDQFRNRAIGFEQSISLATSGGYDMAMMYDSQGNDVLNGDSRQVRLYGDGFNNYVSGFDNLQIMDSGADDHDRLYLRDSAGDDLFELRPEVAELSNADSQVWARGFEYQRVQSVFGGNDQVQLHDSAGADMLVSHASYTSLAGEGYRNLAYGFADVHAFASSLDTRDRVLIYGSDDPDLVEFDNEHGSFVTADSSRYFQGFGWVMAYVDLTNDDVNEGTVNYALRIMDQ